MLRESDSIMGIRYVYRCQLCVWESDTCDMRYGAGRLCFHGRYFVKMYEFSFILISRKSDEDEGVFLC